MAKTTYAKKEIYRVMNWITVEQTGDDRYMISNDLKFSQLKHFFEMYFRNNKK